MKIICKWVFTEQVPETKCKTLKAKQKRIERDSANDIFDMITTLLAQEETVRIIFEKEENKNESNNV